VSEKTLVDRLFETDAELRQAQVCMWSSAFYCHHTVMLSLRLCATCILVNCSLQCGRSVYMKY